jgi:hypothetical protein
MSNYNIVDIECNISTIEKRTLEIKQENKKDECIEINKIIKETKQGLNIVRAEIKKQSPLHNKAYLDRIEKCAQKLKDCEIKMRELMYSKKETNIEKEEVTDCEFQNAQQVLSKGIDINDEILKSLKRSERIANITEDIGQETIKTIRTQTERIVQIDNELSRNESQIERAKRDIKWFYRQMAGNKFCLTIFGIIVIGLALVVFLMVRKKR